MKKLLLVALVVSGLALALVATASAQAPVPGQGIHTPGTGMLQRGQSAGPGANMQQFWPGAAGGRGNMRGGALEWAGESDEVLALLGMTAEQVQAERLAGKSLVQIAAAKDVSEAQLTKTMLDAKQADLAKLVADGKLTQAQADFMYTRMQQQVPVMINRTTTGPAWSQGNGTNAGARGMRGMGRWNR